MRRTVTCPPCIAALLLMLAGCMPSLESTEPPERVYWLDPVVLEEPRSSLAVRVLVVPGLDTDRILILEPDRRLNYYGGAFWPDNLQPLLQSLLSRSLSGPASASGTPVLRVTVERFFALRGAPEAPPVVTLKALVEGAGPDAYRCLFEEHASSATERLRDVVAAHQRLLDELARELDRLAGQPAVRC